MTEIHGTVGSGFGKVADAFAANFEQRHDLGAGFSAYVGGEMVVDIWGGVADARSRRPWDADTLQLVFSTTKGATAICIARLVEAGAISYDEPVATYWPEFAAAGKEAITVGQMMSHQAGLPYVDAPLSFDDVLAVDPVVEAIAAQAPVWEPGSKHGYHALTYGWLAGELLRRVDGRSLGRYVAEEVAAPLGLEFWIGLPAREEGRVSRLEDAPQPTDPAIAQMIETFMGPTTILYKALTMSGALDGFSEGEQPFNTRAVHATEMPAANGITTARSLARMYAATVGEVDGIRLIDEATMKSAGTEAVNGPDACLIVPSRFGYGFMLDGMLTPMFGPNSFGHAGAGGSLGYADPDAKIGYGYVMNQMGGAIAGDPRTVALTDALRASL
jgi:CubicO group peptidase (beta-lactamase class C family)